MAEDKIEVQDPPKNPDGEQDPPENPVELSGTPEEQIAQLTLAQQGNYERCQKEKKKRIELETELKTKGEELATLKPPEKKEDKPEPKVPDDIEERVELRLQGHSSVSA